jgi:hypothetical protein
MVPTGLVRRDGQTLPANPPNPTPRTLTLDESDGSVRVIFPTVPVWVYWFPICINVATGLLVLVDFLYMAIRFWRMAMKWPHASADLEHYLQREVFSGVTVAVVGATLFWGVAAVLLWTYRRFGRVPRILAASEQSLTLSRLRWWRIRQRTWPASEIESIELKPVSGNLTWWRTVNDLVIHPRHGWRIRFRLSSLDSKLPNQIANRMASALHCRLRT